MGEVLAMERPIEGLIDYTIQCGQCAQLLCTTCAQCHKPGCKHYVYMCYSSGPFRILPARLVCSNSIQLTTEDLARIDPREPWGGGE